MDEDLRQGIIQSLELQLENLKELLRNCPDENFNQTETIKKMDTNVVYWNYHKLGAVECGGDGDCFYYSLGFLIHKLGFVLKPSNKYSTKIKDLSRENCAFNREEQMLYLRKVIQHEIKGISTDVELIALEDEGIEDDESLEKRLENVITYHGRRGVFATQPVISMFIPLLNRIGITGIYILQDSGRNKLLYCCESKNVYKNRTDKFVLFVNIQRRGLQHYKLGFYFDENNNEKNFVFNRNGIFNLGYEQMNIIEFI